MEASNASERQGRHARDDDFGLEHAIQEYHLHGGAQGDDHARALEGDICCTHAQHDHHLKKARPDSTAVRRAK
jgi:hypothetical protein